MDGSLDTGPRLDLLTVCTVCNDATCAECGLCPSCVGHAAECKGRR